MNHWIVVAITLFFSALCSGLEIAFNSINRLQLEVELTKNTFSARLIRIFLKDQSRFLTSLLLGNNIALIIYGISMSQLLEAPVTHWLQAISICNDFTVKVFANAFQFYCDLFVHLFSLAVEFVLWKK